MLKVDKIAEIPTVTPIEAIPAIWDAVNFVENHALKIILWVLRWITAHSISWTSCQSFCCVSSNSCISVLDRARCYWKHSQWDLFQSCWRVTSYLRTDSELVGSLCYYTWSCEVEQCIWSIKSNPWRREASLTIYESIWDLTWYKELIQMLANFIVTKQTENKTVALSLNL